MADVTISNSPVHSESMISYPYGEIDARLFMWLAYWC